MELPEANLWRNSKMQISVLLNRFSVVCWCVILFSAITARVEAETIRSAKELRKLCQNPNGIFSLGADIEFDSSDYWAPCEFYGNLNGADFTIRGLKVQSKGDSPVGLFSKIIPDPKFGCNDNYWSTGSWTSGCDLEGKDLPKISDLNIETAEVSGRNEAGILAGKAAFAQIYNVKVQGRVSGGNGVGLVVGRAGSYSKLNRCEATGNIEAINDAGGIAGSVFFSHLSNSESHSKIYGNNNLGGIVGKATSSILSDAVSSSVVHGSDSVGGVIGVLFGSRRGAVFDSVSGTKGIGFQSWLDQLPLDDLAFLHPEMFQGCYLDGKSYKYNGYCSNNEPDGYLPYYAFWKGKFGDTRIKTHSESGYLDSELKVSADRTLTAGLSIESRAFQLVSRGEVICRSNCGGIVGVNVDDVVAVSHIIHSGVVIGSANIGQFFGNGLPLVRPINYVASGYALKPKFSKTLFGSFPGKVGWILEMSAPGDEDLRRRMELLNIPKKSKFVQSAAYIQWPSSFYPVGISTPMRIAGGSLIFERVQSNKYTGKCKFDFLQSWQNGCVGKCDDPIPNKALTGITNGIENTTFAKYFPPVPRKLISSLKAGSCLDLRSIFQIEKDEKTDYSMHEEISGWNLKGDSLCLETEGLKYPVYVSIQYAGQQKRGKSWFRVFAE